MNQTLAYLALALFLTLTPGVFVARFLLGTKFPWWFAFPLIIAGSWFLVATANLFYGEYVCEPVRGAWSPPPEDLARCTNDGGRNVSTVVFGWVYGLAYSAPCFALYSAASWLRGRSTGHGEHAA
jgi:hypothetical protein